MHRLKQQYRDEIVPRMMEEFGYSSVMQVPRVLKITINVGLGEALQNANAIEAASRDVTKVSGQKPIVTRARKSIANFKLREGNPIGVMVTLRQERMYSFLDRLMNIALPRQRDFRGLSRRSFDGHGNYSLGLTEQLVFVEIDYDEIDKVRGMSVSIVTSAKTDEEGRRLLELMGMPFVAAVSQAAA